MVEKKYITYHIPDASGGVNMRELFNENHDSETGQFVEGGGSGGGSSSGENSGGSPSDSNNPSSGSAVRHANPSTKEEVMENMEWQKQTAQKTTAIAQENGWKSSVGNKQAQEWEIGLYKPGDNIPKSEAESLITKLPKGEGITIAPSFDEMSEKWGVTVLVAR